MRGSKFLVVGLLVKKEWTATAAGEVVVGIVPRRLWVSVVSVAIS